MRAAALLAVIASFALPCAAHAATGGAVPFSAVQAGGASADPAAVAKAEAEAPKAQAPATAASTRARIVGGRAIPPARAPEAVKAAILRANRIIGLPYRWGGGHRRFVDRGYDCSGSVSFALNGGGLLASPLDSSSFMRWGRRGAGRWLTVYTNPGHAYLEIAGIRLDTSSAFDPHGGRGPRWRPVRGSHRGFAARHYPGL